MIDRHFIGEMFFGTLFCQPCFIPFLFCRCKELVLRSPRMPPTRGRSPHMASLTAMEIALGVMSFVTVAALAAALVNWRKLKSERTQMRAKLATIKNNDHQKHPLLDVPDSNNKTSAAVAVTADNEAAPHDDSNDAKNESQA